MRRQDRTLLAGMGRQVLGTLDAGTRDARKRACGRREQLALLLARIGKLEAQLTPPRSLPPAPAAGRAATVTAAQRLNRAAATLAGSVLLDSAVEHYRGHFRNRAMWTPLVVSAVTLAISAHGHADERGRAHRTRDAVYAVAAATGVVGTGFHLYNVLKRPGRLAWQNLFYGAPLGAPAAILLSGLLGVAAERVRDHPPAAPARLLGLPAGRFLAALGGAGILGTVAEAALLHFRGAFQNPAMWVPVTVPPVAAGLLANAALGPARRWRRFTRWWLRLTALVGVAGVAFHAWGVQRMMGGWRNWTQNLLDGPPLPAPPAFTGLALAGLAALGLLDDHPDA